MTVPPCWLCKRVYCQWQTAMLTAERCCNHLVSLKPNSTIFFLWIKGQSSGHEEPYSGREKELYYVFCGFGRPLSRPGKITCPLVFELGGHDWWYKLRACSSKSIGCIMGKQSHALLLQFWRRFFICHINRTQSNLVKFTLCSWPMPVEWWAATETNSSYKPVPLSRALKLWT